MIPVALEAVRMPSKGDHTGESRGQAQASESRDDGVGTSVHSDTTRPPVDELGGFGSHTSVLSRHTNTPSVVNNTKPPTNMSGNVRMH